MDDIVIGYMQVSALNFELSVELKTWVGISYGEKLQ